MEECEPEYEVDEGAAGGLGHRPEDCHNPRQMLMIMHKLADFFPWVHGWADCLYGLLGLVEEGKYFINLFLLSFIGYFENFHFLEDFQ